MSTGGGSERFRSGGKDDIGPYEPDYSITGQDTPGVNERILENMPPGPGITPSEVLFYFTLFSVMALPLLLPVAYLETHNPGAIMRIIKSIPGSFGPMIFGQ